MDSNANDADTNGSQEIKKNIQEYAQNAKARIGINQEPIVKNLSKKSASAFC